MSRNPSALQPAAGLLLSAALAATGALTVTRAVAAPVSFITGSVAQVDANPHGNNNFSVDRDIGQQHQASAAAAFNRSGGGVGSSASASADLQSGKVRVGTNLSIQNQPDGFVAMATGFIGDSYRHFAGNDPFTWAGNTTARFDMHITGNASLSGNVRDLFNAGLVFLLIYPRDSLDDGSIPFCGAFQSYFWSIGPSAGRQTPCNGGFEGSLDGLVDRMVSKTFHHDGDFDWVFGIRVGGAASANPNTTVTWMNDFLNTAELFYTPPSGVSSVTSGSGLLLSPGPDRAVPLPGSLTTLALGLALLAAGSRRTHRLRPQARA